MSPAERTVWLRAQRAAQRMRPDLRDAIERGWDQIREAVPPTAEIRRLIERGDAEGLARVVISDDKAKQAFSTASNLLRGNVERTAAATEAAMPSRIRPAIGTRFDQLNPAVIDAILRLESETLGRLTDDARATVRQVVERGMANGDPLSDIARRLRETIGLTPRQEQIIENYRQELLGNRKGNPLGRALRDRRFDARTARGKLTAEQIEKQVDAYRRRMLNHSANVYAKTVASEAQKIGNQASWRAAAETLTDGSVVLKQWHHSPIPEEPRPEHLALDGTEVMINLPYPNGDMYPGQHDPWNCMCFETYRVQYAIQPVAA